jgi:hypothetical protein
VGDLHPTAALEVATFRENRKGRGQKLLAMTISTEAQQNGAMALKVLIKLQRSSRLVPMNYF